MLYLASILLTGLLADTAVVLPAAPPTPMAPPLRIDVNAQPPTLRLVPGATSEVAIEIKDTTGITRDVAPPTVRAVRGTMGALRRVGPGEFRATYQAPDEKKPGVDCVVVEHAPSGAVGWVPVRLAAVAKVPLRVSKPWAELHVSLAGRTYDPVVADATGRATLELVIPPGAGQLDIRAVDSAGNATTTKENIPMPGYDRLWVVVGRAPGAAADAPQGFVDVLAVNWSGWRAKELRPKVSAQSVALSEALEVGEGHQRYAFVAPPGTERRTEQITVLHGSNKAVAEIQVAPSASVALADADRRSANASRNYGLPEWASSSSVNMNAVVMNGGNPSGTLLGIGLDWRVPLLWSGFGGLGASADIIGGNLGEREFDALIAETTGVFALPLSLFAYMRFPLPTERLLLYARGGGLFSLVFTETKIASESRSESTGALGGSVGLGLEFPFRDRAGFIETSYVRTSVPLASTDEVALGGVQFRMGFQVF